MSLVLSRRALLLGATATLAGCDRLAQHESVRGALFSAENFHKWAQRSLMARDAMAREFRPDQISPFFRSNGTANPNTPEYRALWRSDFADWRLKVTGLVYRSRSPNSAACPIAIRSPATTVSKDGAPSANGAACRFTLSSTRRV
jgi:DMSO/TMAO reductase YedYZ molybdopterin-dependent catalytic subunit